MSEPKEVKATPIVPVQDGITPMLRGEEKQRDLLKLGDDKYMVREWRPKEKLYLEQTYTKESLKETYDTLKLQRTNLIAKYNKTKKALKDIDAEDNEELQELKKKLEAIQALGQKDAYEKDVVQMDKDKEYFDKEMKLIERVIPEVVRNK